MLNPVSIQVQANLGTVMGQGGVERCETRAVEFPEFKAVLRIGEVVASTAWGSALFLDGEPVPQNSLLFQTRGWNRTRVADQMIEKMEAATPDLANLEIDQPIVSAIGDGFGTWGHAAIQMIPRLKILLEEFPEAVAVVPAAGIRGRYQASFDLIKAIGIPLDRLIPVENNTRILAPGVCLMDIPQHRGVLHPRLFELFEDVRIRLRGAGNLPQEANRASTESLLLIKRMRTREVVNLEAIVARLPNWSINSCQMTGGLETQVGHWRATTSALAVTGSDLTNMVFGDVSRIFTISPSWHPDNFFFCLAAIRGIEWNELVIPESNICEPRTPLIMSSFAVPPPLFSRWVSRWG